MNRINGNDLLAIGFTQGKILGLALEVLEKHYQDADRDMVLSMMKALAEKPELYLDHEILEDLATKMIEEASAPKDETIDLNVTAKEFAVYGQEHIDEGAVRQMNIAMRLPVTVAGALMPDAHQGYGLPIGGVLAAKNAVIPYGVGVDIGCRMALSIFDIPENHYFENHDFYKKELIAHTRFGAGHGFMRKERAEHAVLDRNEFNMTQFIKNLHDKAWSQLGSSGGGNHFVEWGIIEFSEEDKLLNIAAGRYLALLSHSGSRGLGATLAGHYTRLAKDICKLPKDAANLAYLDMNSEAGQEYWLAMNLAGDYASACHEVIHDKMAKAIGGQLLAKVENHHNFEIGRAHV